MFYIFSLPSGVYVWTLNLLAPIPGPSILTMLLPEAMNIGININA